MAPNKPHYPTTKRRSPNYAASTSWEDRQYLFNGARDVRTYLRSSIPTFPSRSFSSVLQRATVWRSGVHGRYWMHSKDSRINVQIPTRHWRMDKEDIAGSPHHVYTNIRSRNWNINHNGRFSELLATGRRKDFVIFQWSDVFSLESGSLPFHALSNACCISHSLRKERHSPKVVGNRIDGSSWKDNRK